MSTATGSYLLNVEHNGKTMRADIVVMRLGLIFLLVFNHAFAPFCGSWNPISDTEHVGVYGYLSNAAHYISMPALIFISGYLFGHSWHKTANQSFKDFAIKKFKRLIIPSIIFSVFYYFFFYDLTLPVSHIAYSVVNGCGHLWFLPMLFWCFIFSFIIGKFRINKKIVLGLSIMLAMLPVPSLPLRLAQVTNYFPFYYAGIVIAQMGGGKQPLSKYVMWLIIATVTYILLQVWSLNYTINDESFITKIFTLCVANAIKVGLGFSGIATAYIATLLFLRNRSSLGPAFIILSTYCYGVYIFHQFLLKALYYHTSLPAIV